MRRQFIYPAQVDRDEAGYYLVTFPDLPEAGTDGATLQEALIEAADCLAEAVAGRLARSEEIPLASRRQKGQYPIVLPGQIAAKTALYLAMREAGIGKAELASRLDCDQKAIQCLLDPRQPSELRDVEEALATIGQELVVTMQAVAHG